MDTEKFVKIIAKTSSKYDGEVLNAIKLCNEMLRNEKLTWEEFLTRDKKEIKMLKEQIDDLLNYIFDNIGENYGK